MRFYILFATKNTESFLISSKIVFSSKLIHKNSVIYGISKKLNEKETKLRQNFRSLELKFHNDILKLDQLKCDDRIIHDLHEAAVKNLHFTYDDPSTNLKVITRYRHFLKGSCCGSACRHVSIYGCSFICYLQ